ncbi:MAG: DNA mismatch repair protein MutS [Flexilinea sp.]|nr:DNA mismatch repair protein MutS [Flexilinea sp.]
MSENNSPSRQQYLDIKKQYPDAILFFRLGDFYETFDEDAEITSRELDLVLTSKSFGNNQRVPMAGIPYHAVENYLARMIEKGYHVAICEQMGNQAVNGLFPREVIRIVTPGTLIEPGLLRKDTNNYLMSAFVSGNILGIAYADITTGEFYTTEIRTGRIMTDLMSEVTRLNPAEIILSDRSELDLPGSLHITRIPAVNFEPVRAANVLMDHFSVTTLDGFGLSAKSASVSAAGAIISYLNKNQANCLQLLTRISIYSLDEFMLLDSSTRRNLELTETLRGKDVNGSLLGVLDRTVTPMGKRLIRQWVNKPLISLDMIHVRQKAVGCLLDNGMTRAEIAASMKGISDLERLINRIGSKNAIPRDLVAMRESLCILPEIIDNVEPLMPVLGPAVGKLKPLSEIYEILSESIADEPPATLGNTGIIRRGYSDELDSVLLHSKEAREWMASLESKERERTGIKTLKVSYNKVFGYYIEISRVLAEQAPENYIRKQTLVNAERFITPEMKEYEALILNADETIHQIELRLFEQICHEVSQYSEDVISVARGLGTLDVLISLAEAAAVNNYVCPVVDDSKKLNIIAGRHPVVEKMMAKGTSFIPNDVRFEEGEIIRVITGPNMSGKSTFLRQTAIIILMAQMGSFVPAEKAEIGIVDRIFTRIGAQDEIHAGLSTFMVEMVETANILNNATDKSLLILDEIGRGTSTYDGVSIAWAIVEYIHNAPKLRARTLFATHYHELTKIAETLPGVRNYNVAVSETNGEVIFLHKIISGAADRSYGIHVAQIAGLPKPVINRANEILYRLESDDHQQTLNETSVPTEQLLLFPETNPILDALRDLDVDNLSPIEAINMLYTWKHKFE